MKVPELSLVKLTVPLGIRAGGVITRVIVEVTDGKLGDEALTRTV